MIGTLVGLAQMLATYLPTSKRPSSSD